MINCKYEKTDPTFQKIIGQVARMEQLEDFPFGDPAKRELCLALCVADSLEEITQLVNDFVHHERIAPKPAEIRRILYDRQERAEEDRKEQERAKWAKDRTHPAELMVGIFKRGRDALADRHLDLIRLRIEELKDNRSFAKFDANRRRPETVVSRELRELTEQLRGATD